MTQAFVIGFIGPLQAFIVVLMLLLLFGGKKIPEMMRALGQGLQEFKKVTRENNPEGEAGKSEPEPPTKPLDQ